MLRLHLRTASAGVLPARAAAEVYKGVSRAEPGGLTVVARLLSVTHRAVATSNRARDGHVRNGH